MTDRRDRGAAAVEMAIVLDVGSRRVVGWALRSSLETELVLAALHVALGVRPAPQLHHSDRGVQYASDAYRRVLERRGIIELGRGWIRVKCLKQLQTYAALLLAFCLNNF